MFNAEESSNRVAATDVIASDTQAAFKAIDEALLMQAQLLVTTLQAAKIHPVRIGTSQRLYSSFDQGVQGILESRQAMAKSVVMLRAIARASGTEERLEGCADGLPSTVFAPFLKADAPVEAASR